MNLRKAFYEWLLSETYHHAVSICTLQKEELGGADLPPLLFHLIELVLEREQHVVWISRRAALVSSGAGDA